jgi:hypothetical protein
MAFTPGELLVRGGIISAEAHRRALAQRAPGSSFGESLIRLGLIDEVGLATFYHKRLVLPLLEERNLQRVPREVLATVPAEVAAEFRVLPLAFDREGALLVAMADPSDNHAVDELGFFVNRFILRAVATESAVRRAIERHYKLNLGVGAERAPTSIMPRPVVEVPRVAPPRAREITPPTEPIFPTSDERARDPFGRSGAVLPPEPTPDRDEPVLLTRKKRVDETPLPPPAPPQKDFATPAAPAAVAAPRNEEPHLLTHKRRERVSTLPGLSPSAALPLARLRAARQRDEVARLLLDYAAQVLGRAVLFVVRSGTLVGFDARGGGLERASVEVLQVPLAADSLFRDVTQAQLAYRGPLPPTAHNRTLARALGTQPDAEVLMLPILVRDRVVAVLFGDSPATALPEASLQTLCHEAGLAYERILRQARAMSIDPGR